ncbi:MAG: CarD family transcriptional regulator [Lachnospirales bacterium]
MFQKNDIVLYGTHSVCRIEDISELRFNKDPATYYILKPVYRKESTIFVPVANAMLSDKMHAILTLEEVEHLLHILPDEPSSWLENSERRKERYRHFLTDCDRLGLLKIIRDLHHQQRKQISRGRKLYASDEAILREAERLISDEFAYVLHISRSQVEGLIRSHLQKTEIKNTDKKTSVYEEIGMIGFEPTTSAM